MELHAPGGGAIVALRFADEIRAEMARKRLTATDLAAALGITPHTVGRRLNGDSPFNVIELVKAAQFVGISLIELVRRATVERSEAVAS